MDKVKVILKQLQKYHFWLLCVVAMIVGLVGWMMGANKISAAYSTEKSKILAKFDALNNIRKEEKIPNTEWKNGITKLSDQERAKVRKAWELVYNEQKVLLKWPEQLEQGFRDFVENKPEDAIIPLDMCGHYAEVIPRTEPARLLAIANATTGGVVAPGEKAEKGPERVVWAKANYDSFVGLLQWKNTPESKDVRRAQEDLWVYSALLTIISKINAGQVVPRIKLISEIHIGRPAADQFEVGKQSGQVERPKVAEGSGGDAAAAAAPAATPPAPKSEGEAKPDDGRYVDAKGSKLAEASGDEQFKRMPVYMKLVMDQREISKLLVECANSPLPLEVCQLRINAGGKIATPSATGAAPKGAPTDAEVFDVPVEVTGIIYIFNKPDPAKLGEAPAEGAPAAGEPAPPAGN